MFGAGAAGGTAGAFVTMGATGAFVTTGPADALLAATVAGADFGAAVMTDLRGTTGAWLAWTATDAFVALGFAIPCVAEARGAFVAFAGAVRAAMVASLLGEDTVVLVFDELEQAARSIIVQMAIARTRKIRLFLIPASYFNFLSESA